MKNINAISIAHELKRCEDDFARFVGLYFHVSQNNHNLDFAIACYEAYVDFASHLYEFYKALIKSDARYNCKKNIDIDAAVNEEACRLLKIRRDRIDRGAAPPWENDISHYEIAVPKNFGKDLRIVRNIRSHCDLNRVQFDVGQFFNMYHRFLLILYEEAIWLWDYRCTSEHDWGAIGSFAATITKNG